MEPSLKETSHILTDTFDFVEGTEKNLEIGAVCYFKLFRTQITWVIDWKTATQK